MKIILLRHGKPKTPPIFNMTALEFSKWVEQYDLSGLCPSSQPETNTVFVANSCNAVVCSELPRSIESSSVLGIKTITLTSRKFNEAGLPITEYGHLKLSPRIWVIILRVLWLLGYTKKSESYKDAKIRATESVKTLTALAKTHSSVLFVGHGVYNRLLAKELISLGWVGPKSPGSKHWSFGVYKK